MLKVDKILLGDIGVALLILGIIGLIITTIFESKIIIAFIIITVLGLLLMWSEGEARA